MAPTHADNLLRQKASTARKERETREMTPARALRLGFARAAGQLWDLPMDVLSVEETVCGLEDVAQQLPGGALMLLLDGPDGARGALALDCAVMTAMVEVQTIGVVSPKPPDARTPTPTDAAMIVPWLDGALERADVVLRQSGGPDDQDTNPDDWSIGYRFGAMAENARALMLALDAPDLHRLRIELDVGVGARQGSCTLLLPVRASATPDAPVADAQARERAREAMMRVPAELQVVAGRLSLTVAQASQLKPGECLPIDDLLLPSAELQTADGTAHGTARLGKIDGHWAIRIGGTLEDTPDPAGAAGDPVDAHLPQDTQPATASRAAAPGVPSKQPAQLPAQLPAVTGPGAASQGAAPAERQRDATGNVNFE